MRREEGESVSGVRAVPKQTARVERGGGASRRTTFYQKNPVGGRDNHLLALHELERDGAGRKEGERGREALGRAVNAERDGGATRWTTNYQTYSGRKACQPLHSQRELERISAERLRE